ncbi:hypothetical protein T11_8811 [Trichinella zimbabwensis]|uniref:Uncharacterized protein n=1 Tax=Trichinella zimbabwensis TaxID=268475 RepID=A0A0V1H2Y0_9BILA|nr:hypothetical protein T11_8811 [Trichinella zimbabwensis]
MTIVHLTINAVFEFYYFPTLNGLYLSSIKNAKMERYRSASSIDLLQMVSMIHRTKVQSGLL